MLLLVLEAWVCRSFRKHGRGSTLLYWSLTRMETFEVGES